MAKKYENESYVRGLHAEYISEGLTLCELGKRYKLDYGRVSIAFKKFGLHVRTNSEYRTTYPNDNFFSAITTEIQAYLLGFFASDGHIEFRSYGSYALKWDIQERDVELLRLVNEYIGNSTYNVYRCKDRPIVGITITSKQIGLDLLKLGYDNHKTHTCTKLPDIRPELMHHFLRGYFDGDGSVGVNKAKRGYNRFLSFAARSENILKEIEALLPKKYKSRITFKEEVFGSRLTSCYRLDYNSRHDIGLIHQYLYEDANFYLQRKYRKCCLTKLTAKELAASRGNSSRKSGELLETP